jgi:hypothetical protein
MPNVEGINLNPDGTARWTIRAEIPLIGAMRQSFTVEVAENSDERIEWIPKRGETQNLLRYAADFIEKDANLTLVQLLKTSNCAAFRQRASFLAGLAGESRVSKGMQMEVAGMIKNFVRRAKEKLEKANN